MPHTITINLSDALYEQLKRAAELSRQPTETIIMQSLTHTLPPLLEEIPTQYQLDVYPLLQMSDADLQREALRTLITLKRASAVSVISAESAVQRMRADWNAGPRVVWIDGAER